MIVRVALIGAGSSYAPLIIRAITRAAPPGVSLEFLCVDPVHERLVTNASFVEALLEHDALPAVRMRLAEAFTADDAHVDVVLSLFRSGGLSARQQDEVRARRYGIVAQETVGWGGFVGALRNAPVAAAIASTLRDAKSAAWHLLVSNPVGILTTAASTIRPERTFGVCDMPRKLLVASARAVGVPVHELRASYVGLNHCGWLTGAWRADGTDVLGELLQEPALSAVLAEAGGPNLPSSGHLARVSAQIGAVPTPYLRYYYAREECIAASRHAPLRADDCLEIDRRAVAAYRQLDVERAQGTMSLRGGYGVGEVVASNLWEVIRPSGRSPIRCVPSPAALPYVEPRAATEIYGDPLPSTGGHAHMRALLTQMGAYEVLTADAAVSGDFDTAIVAATTNPWIGSADLAERLLRETVHEQVAFLPQFN